MKQDTLNTIAQVGVPEEWPQESGVASYEQPPHAVTLFFHTEGDAKAFADEAQQHT